MEKKSRSVVYADLNNTPVVSVKVSLDSVSVSVLDEYDIDSVQGVVSVLSDVELFLASLQS